MKIIQKNAIVFNEPCVLTLMDFDNTDRIQWKNLFDKWKDLKMGMRDYQAREPNFPEGLSEVAFCLYTGSKRLLKLTGPSSSSFDTFNLEENRAEQIKATSVENDLTSFGPRSKWDDLYFMDFYNKGKLDGTFNLYKIPTDLIYNSSMNASETFVQQQQAGRRPRLSITSSIVSHAQIKPVATDVKVW